MTNCLSRRTCSLCDNKHYGKGFCQKCYVNNHREQKHRIQKKYYEKNKEKILAYGKAHSKARYKTQAWKDTKKKSHKKLLQNNIQYKLSCDLRTRLWQCIKDGTKAGSAVRDLGCSIEFFKKHLEGLFKEGMNWKNWSMKGWHIDHIIPLYKFDLSNRNDFLIANNWTNLQPMWAKENIQKGSKIK